MHAFFKFFGSKLRSAPYYPEPHHDVIVETHAGSAGYSCKYHDKNIHLFDTDPRVTTIWEYLVRARPKDILNLPILVPGDKVSNLRLPYDERLFLSCCVNTSPFRDTLTQWKNGQNTGLWCEKFRERVAAQVELIKHWKVYNADYEASSMCGKATYFVDPIYQGMAEHYSISKLYPPDYPRLAAWCKSQQGQVIVCEREGANWLPFKPLRSCTATRNKTGKTCKEVYWTND
jgi:hypothetical protein